MGERDQTGQLIRIWIVVPENYRVKATPKLQIENTVITPEGKNQHLTLSEGTYSIHLPLLFPQVKQSSNGQMIPKSKIVKAALERRIQAVFKANLLTQPERIDEE